MMNLVDRYIIRAHIGPFLFGTFTVMFLFLMQFILNNIDKLVGKGLDEWIIIQLIAFNLAWMLVLAVPMGVLFSTLMAFGSMSAAHEVTILKASGGSLVRMMAPALIVGVILSYLLFLFNDRILPDTNHKAKTLISDIQRKKPSFSLESSRFSSEIEGYTILAREVDTTGWLHDVTIYDHKTPQKLNIVSADSGFFNYLAYESKISLDLFSGEVHQMVGNEVNNYRKIEFDDYTIYMDARGFEFSRTGEDVLSRGDRELKIADMQEIVDKSVGRADELQLEIDTSLNSHLNYLSGINEESASDENRKQVITALDDSTASEAYKRVVNRLSFLQSRISSDIRQKEDYLQRAWQYEVEIQKKYAIPFACLVFVLLGCPLGVLTKGGNFGLSAAFSLGFYIVYWACLIGGEKLADRGAVSPALGMWLGNIIIAFAGIILTLRVNFESVFGPLANLFNKLLNRN